MKETRVQIYNIEVLSKGTIILDKPVKVASYNIEVLSKGDILLGDLKPVKVSSYNIEILHAFVPADEEEEALKPYYFNGQVLEVDAPVERDIIAYDQTTFNKVGSITSTVSGTFTLPVTVSGVCFIVCLDDNIGQNYNNLIVATVRPLLY